MRCDTLSSSLVKSATSVTAGGGCQQSCSATVPASWIASPRLPGLPMTDIVAFGTPSCSASMSRLWGPVVATLPRSQYSWEGQVDDRRRDPIEMRLSGALAVASCSAVTVTRSCPPAKAWARELSGSGMCVQRGMRYDDDWDVGAVLEASGDTSEDDVMERAVVGCADDDQVGAGLDRGAGELMGGIAELEAEFGRDSRGAQRCDHLALESCVGRP